MIRNNKIHKIRECDAKQFLGYTLKEKGESLYIELLNLIRDVVNPELPLNYVGLSSASAITGNKGAVEFIMSACGFYWTQTSMGHMGISDMTIQESRCVPVKIGRITEGSFIYLNANLPSREIRIEFKNGNLGTLKIKNASELWKTDEISKQKHFDFGD